MFDGQRDTLGHKRSFLGIFLFCLAMAAAKGWMIGEATLPFPGTTSAWQKEPVAPSVPGTS
jgi:hypothetical protein